jgi:integrase
MRYAMPNPELINSTYYLRLHVPKDVAAKAKGTTVAVPVGETIVHAKVGTVVKVSLRTKEAAEAKRRFLQALPAIERHWDSLRKGPIQLTHKQCVALAGEIYHDFVTIMDDNPGKPETWKQLQDLIADARVPRHKGFEALMVPPRKPTTKHTMEARFGPLADVLLRRHGLLVDEASRWQLVQQVAQALEKASAINLKKAEGDYSDSGITTIFPKFDPPVEKAVQEKAPTPAKPVKLTLSAIVDEQVKRRSLGTAAKPFPAKTVNKFKMVAAEFAKHRGSADATTVTPKEVDAWMVSMLQEGKLSNTTIRQRIGNLSTIIEWAIKQSLGELYPNGNPVAKVTPPEGQSVRSEDRTLRLDEARKILLASRKETKPELRWGPWLLAYSGARVGEIAQLTVNDFFQHGGHWFYRITSKGGKRVKVQSSIRRVPIHPAVVAEGFLTYLRDSGLPKDARLFPVRTNENLQSWIRNDLQLTRKELAPNHGWRHLFEDLALLAGMQESAKRYITGRVTGHSSEGYGKSDAMLPALAAEMQKISCIISMADGNIRRGAERVAEANPQTAARSKWGQATTALYGSLRKPDEGKSSLGDDVR